MTTVSGKFDICGAEGHHITAAVVRATPAAQTAEKVTKGRIASPLKCKKGNRKAAALVRHERQAA